MTFKSKLYNLFSLSIVEQLTLNGGNFLFFILSAKMVGPLEFAKFSILWMGSQIIISISIPWISLPITSKNIDLGNKNIILNALKKIAYLSLLTPVLLILYSYFVDEKLEILEIILMYILGILLVFFDTLRFFLVRNRAVKEALFCNLMKWVFAFILLGSFLGEAIYEDYQIIFTGILLGTLIGVISQVLLIKPYFLKLKKNSIKNENELDMPLFHLGISNLSNSVFMTILFIKIDLIVFGALQAFRSLANFFPFILQYIESHYSAELIKKRKTEFITNKFLTYYFFICFLIILSFYFIAEDLINIIFGESYGEFKDIFIYLSMIIFIQSLSRLINVQNRLQNKNKVFNQSALVLWGSTLGYAYFYNSTENINSNSILLIMLCTSIFQLILYLNATKKLGRYTN